MKNALKIICSLALALALLGCAALCLADGATSQPEVFATSGDAVTNVIFFVNSKGNAQVTLMQPTMGSMRMVSTANSIDALSRSIYGRYKVTYTNGVDSGEEEFNAQVLTLTLKNQGNYMIRVTPYLPENFHEDEENFTPYLLNRYTGSYYKESAWITVPTWTINHTGNCTVSANGTVINDQPAAQSATLVIYYRTVDGGLLSTETRALPAGTHTVYANYSRSGFTQVGSTYYTVTSYGNGSLSTPSVTFYYTKSSTPAPVTQPKLTVYYRTVEGALLSSETRTLTTGTNYVYSNYTKAGYSLVGNSYYTVTVYSNGTLSASSVTFYFSKNATPTPQPTSATLTIYYRTVDGALLSSESRVLPIGTNYVYSNFSKNGYSLVGNSYYTVTVYSNGTLSANTVTFYYNKSITPTPASAQQMLTVYYRTVDGVLLSSETRLLATGMHTIYPNFSSADYVLVGDGFQTVTVYDNGGISAASLTFYYNRKATPTPVPSAKITVYYRLLDGTLLQQETRKVQLGKQYVFSKFQNINYTLTGSSYYTVTVYGTDSASVTSVTFYYEPRTDELAPTDQYALIGADQIFPRPGPNEGDNEKWYAAKGQTVVVHSKAKSQKGDDKWWVCFSGELECWGETFVLDHMWIRYDYFNLESFDLEILPEDPEWPDPNI